MESHIGNIMTLSNSIIGVSILAMPFCFKQCGIILAILMLIISSIITRLTCHFLLKSAIMARRRTFELLAFHAFGTAGKFMVELGIIGFLMGTCIAFFVIIGDLGPAIIAKMMGSKPTDTLRTSILIGVAVFCVLPLGLLKNVDSLHSVSTATIGFYFCLVLKTISESTTHFISGDLLSKVELWRPAGILQCLPIFAMALSCQTQLFEIYETVSNPTLDKMNYIVRVAINICVAVYVCVGFFGYSAFASQSFSGNILMNFSQSSVTDVMKIGFVLSVAFSFPLVIFPCRASLYSLLFKKGYTPYEGSNNYIPEAKFKFLTFLIIAASLVIGILIPNIEVVLGLLGSTIGIMICLIFPVTCFICISTKNTNERLLAQILLFVGVIVMVLGTYANLYAMEQINDINVKIEKPAVLELQNDMKKIESEKMLQAEPIVEVKNEEVKINQETPIRIKEKPEDIRLEPPQPVEPQDENKKINIVEKNIPKIEENVNKIETPINKQKDIHDDKGHVQKVEETITEPLKDTKNIQIETETKKTEEVDVEAIKKEETELQEEEKGKPKEDKDEEKQKAELLKTLEQHKKEQESLIKEQKELIQELKKEKEELKEKQKNENTVELEVRRKAANEILEIAKKAIQQLAPESISKSTLLVQKTANNKIKDTLNNEISKKSIIDKNIENKMNATSIIKDPIAKKIMEFANSNAPTNVNEKNVQNTNLLNSVQKEKMIPLPIVVNQVLADKKLKSQNENQVNEINNKNDNLFVHNNSNTILSENNLNNEKLSKVNNEEKQIIGNNVISETKQNVDKKNNNEIIQNIQETPKIKEEENLIVPEENILSAKRNMLVKEENINDLIRIRRDTNDITENTNNEKCELTEKDEAPSSSAVKAVTEISKSDILKIESSHIIQSMKSQLKAETLRMRKK